MKLKFNTVPTAWAACKAETMRTIVRFSATALIALTAAISAVAPVSAQAALPLGAQIDVTSCAYPPGQIVAGNKTRQYAIDTSSLYAGVYVPTNVPGGHFQIKGQYPKSAWFDWTSNNNNIPLNTFAAIDDVAIAPDPGSVNPYLPGVNYDSNHNYYTINVKDAPVQQRTNEANVLWGGWSPDPAIPNALQKATGQLLLYYIEGADGATDPSLQGGVPIPSISWVVDNPTTNPYQSQAQVCAAMYQAGSYTKWIWAINKPLDQYIWSKYAANFYDLYNLPLPLLAAPPSRHPAPSVARPSPGGYWWPLFNEQATYVGFAPSILFGKFYTIRFKVPTHDSTAFGIPRTGLEQTQFWSWCSGSVYSVAFMTRTCLNDRDFHPDANGYVTIVVSPADQRPVVNGKPYADWLEWAGSGAGVFWQIVDPNPVTWPQEPGLLPQSIWQHVPLVGDMVSGANPSNVMKMKSLMGEYYPTLEYCSKADVEAGNTCQ